MSFVNLSLLGGAALVAVPIVLHLIMRRKPRHLEFPALRFIQKQHDTNQRKLLLRHLLLLLLRAAAIALVAFALARPSLQLSAIGADREAPVAVAMVFDTSPRLEYRHKNQTRLEVAGETGLWLLAQLPRESEIAVLDTRLAAAAFEVDRGTARERIERLAPAANSQPLTSVIEKAVDLLRSSELERKEIYVFTDLARVSWPPGAASRLQAKLGSLPGVGIYLIDVGVEKPADFALGELRLPRQVLSSRGALVVQSDVAAVGTEGQRTVVLDLLVTDPATGARRIEKRSEQVATLAEGQSQQILFRVGGLSTGSHQGLLRIVGDDGLEVDNTRYFTFEVKPAWRVLIVAPKKPHVFPNFLSEALAPSAFRLAGQARFDCRTIAQQQLAGEKLDDYAAVCLLDPEPMRPVDWQKLVNYAADGHGVAIFLGREAEPIDTLNEPAAQQLLPGKLVMRVRRPDFDTHPAPTALQHPILREFGRLSTPVPWDAFPVLEYWQIGELAKGASVLVRYSDGGAAMLERPVGRGRVVVMTTPVSDNLNRDPWNFLPVEQSWPFMILANETVAYLVGSSEEQLNYYAGQTVTLRLDPSSTRRSYVVTAPGGVTFPLTADLQQEQLVVSDPETLGNYRVQAGGTSGVDRGFSVNLRPEQTRMDRIDADGLEAMFGSHRYRLARDRSQIQRDVNLGRVGQELFPYLMILIVLILASEHILANRFYRN